MEGKKGEISLENQEIKLFVGLKRVTAEMQGALETAY